MKAQDSRSQEIQSFLSENGLPANFCIAPWINGDLDQLGTIFACHRYDDKKLPLGNWKDELFSEEFNSENYQKLRGMFHNNEKPRSCQTCWDKEDYGNFSTRHEFLEDFVRDCKENDPRALAVLEKIKSKNITAEVSDIDRLEVRKSILCNLQCRHCGAESSSKWLSVYKQDPTIGDWSLGVPKTEEDYKWLLYFKNQVMDEYLRDVLDVSKDCRIIQFSGGEPLIEPAHAEFVKELHHNAKNIQLDYNSNLNVKESIIEKFAELWKPFRKIFVSRDKAHTRKLNNASELLMALKGWESVTLEDLPIKEQVKVFAEASHVLATHGAGMVNALWCKEGTKVVEIQDENMLHKKVYPLLSNSLKLKHEVFVAKTTPIETDGKKPKGVKRLNDLINFNVDIPKLIRHLD